MKLYAHIYKNHNGKYTQQPYRDILYTSIDAANYDRRNLEKEAKKNLKLVRVRLEKV